MQVGRNEPCPCGSGKKYKKCCALKEELPDLSLPDDLKTGTPLDAYLELMPVISLFYQGLLEFDGDKGELERRSRDFEERFLPGTEEGVNDGLYLPWVLFDLRFGKSKKTVCERFLEDRTLGKVGEPALTFIRHMSDSYATFYEVANVTKGHVEFLELGTGVSWNVHILPDSYEDIHRGDIWYTRFVGPADNAFEFSAPYIFLPDSKEIFILAVNKQVEETRKTLGALVESRRLFRESCKEALEGWTVLMLDDEEASDEEMDDEEASEASMPALFNTDGEPMRFCKIVFKIDEEAEAKDRLNSMKSFDYDKPNKTWIWFKKGNKQISLSPKTSLGTVKISRGRLTAETNSEERAEKLVKKLKKELQGVASFEKMEVKDFDNLPPLTEKQRERAETQHEKLMQDPEVRETARRMAEEYYHNEWLTKPIPALSGKSPLEAVKTPEGRRKVKDLVDGLEDLQNDRPEEPFRVDMAGLRARLGL